MRSQCRWLVCLVLLLHAHLANALPLHANANASSLVARRLFSAQPGAEGSIDCFGDKTLCKHGTCELYLDSGVNIAHCNCADGWRGIYCDHKPGCFPPCEYGGTCDVALNTCSCAPGHTGHGCQLLTDGTDTGTGVRPSCGQVELRPMFDKIDNMCCVSPNGKQSGCGASVPKECSAACADVFNVMWSTCGILFASLREQFEGFAAKCARTSMNNAGMGNVGVGMGLVDQDDGACRIDKKYPFRWHEISPYQLEQDGGNIEGSDCVDSTETRFTSDTDTSTLLSCPQLESFCEHTVYGELVSEDCPATCGMCVGHCQDTAKTSFIVEGTSQDARLPCVQLQKFCTDPRFGAKVVEECPLTCGTCTVHIPRALTGSGQVGTLIEKGMWTSNGANQWESDDGWYDLQLPTTGIWRRGFPYYGRRMRTVSIGTNGLLTFGTPQFKYGATEPIPCSSTESCFDGVSNGIGVDGIIAAMWADLYPGASGGDVYYLFTDESLIIEYAAVKSWSYTCPLINPETRQRNTCWNLPDPGQSFQIELYPSGDFVFRYLSMYCPTCLASWSSVSIGFEDHDGLKGQQLAYGAIPRDRTAYYIPAACTASGSGH